jgi:hypothetical protein
MSGEGEVTRLLVDWSAGDHAALDRLLPLVYDELRRLAKSHMRRERRTASFRRPRSFMRRTCGWSIRRTSAGRRARTFSRWRRK